MPLMLQIVKYRYLWTGAQQRRRKARIQHHVQAQSRRRQRQNGLLPKNARRPRRRAHRLRRMDEIGSGGDQVGAGLTVGEDEILV